MQCLQLARLMFHETDGAFDVSIGTGLERLLLDFDGSVLLVTHDRYFLDKVATAILAFEGEGRVVRYPGNFEMYRTLKEQAAAAATAARPQARPPGPEPKGEGAPKTARRPGKLSFHEQRELDGMEAALLAAEERKATLEAALSRPETYQGASASSVGAMRAEIDALALEIEGLYARWQELDSIRAEGASRGG